jgi:L-threonylcarbamoyladenylate synthase
MRVIRQNEINIDEIVTALAEGKTVVYPTETCYGLGCDATNPAAVEKIFALKGREKGRPLLVIVHDFSAMAPYIEITPALQAFAEKYWPGAVTVVTSTTPHPSFPRRGIEHILPLGKGELEGVDPLAPGVVVEDGTVAFRVTSHPFARALCEAFGKPVVSTSANIAGGPNPYTIEEAVEADIRIDAGELPRRPPSTIVRLDGDHMDIVRQGDVVVSV